ncbi:MAG: hypothetical protein OXR82_00440 [Gammaproteobacteria bacterium]|nr:hypothetical protein [Gammaproteobacteria bacterium]
MGPQPADGSRPLHIGGVSDLAGRHAGSPESSPDQPTPNAAFRIERVATTTSNGRRWVRTMVLRPYGSALGAVPWLAKDVGSMVGFEPDAFSSPAVVFVPT